MKIDDTAVGLLKKMCYEIEYNMELKGGCHFPATLLDVCLDAKTFLDNQGIQYPYGVGKEGHECNS